MISRIRIATAGALIVSTLALSGCFPLAATGVAVGTMAVLDRRTVGAQTEDQAIELKSLSQLQGAIAQAGGISVTSYNRKVLLTGQVASEQDKLQAARVVAAIDNVRSVHNELQVLGRPSLTASAADTSITARVKAALVRTQDVHANTIKVVTESGTVYLMGLVSQREADVAAHVASQVSGVQRVVTVFELITEEEVRRFHDATKAN
jgi:osmotically-inducible protein OsmY